jgi:hypothetical protein
MIIKTGSNREKEAMLPITVAEFIRLVFQDREAFSIPSNKIQFNLINFKY